MRLRPSSILAPDGRPVLIATEPPYRAAGGGRRFVGFTAPIGLGPNAALLPGLDTLRARARALYRNDPQVKGGIDKLVANLVGSGLYPRSLHPTASVREQINTVRSEEHTSELQS